MTNDKQPPKVKDVTEMVRKTFSSEETPKETCHCGHKIEDHVHGGCCYFPEGLSPGKFLCKCEKFEEPQTLSCSNRIKGDKVSLSDKIFDRTVGTSTLVHHPEYSILVSDIEKTLKAFLEDYNEECSGGGHIDFGENDLIRLLKKHFGKPLMPKDEELLR